MRRFAERLRRATFITIVAEAADALPADWLAHRLQLAGLRAQAVPLGTVDGAQHLATLRRGDVLLAVQIASSGTEVLRRLADARTSGIPVLAIATDEPVAGAGELALRCTAGSGAVCYFALVDSL